LLNGSVTVLSVTLWVSDITEAATLFLWFTKPFYSYKTLEMCYTYRPTDQALASCSSVTTAPLWGQKHTQLNPSWGWLTINSSRGRLDLVPAPKHTLLSQALSSCPERGCSVVIILVGQKVFRTESWSAVFLQQLLEFKSFGMHRTHRSIWVMLIAVSLRCLMKKTIQSSKEMLGMDPVRRRNAVSYHRPMIARPPALKPVVMPPGLNPCVPPHTVSPSVYGTEWNIIVCILQLTRSPLCRRRRLPLAPHVKLLY